MTTYRQDYEVDFIPERDGATWATDEAPWVGAESDWKTGTIPPPPAEGQDQPEVAAARNSLVDLEMTSEELETVLSTLAPPVPEKEAEKSGGKFISYIGIALAAGLLTWTVFNVNMIYNADNQPGDSMSSTASMMPLVPMKAPDVSGTIPAAAAPSSEEADDIRDDFPEEITAEIEEEVAERKREARKERRSRTESDPSGMAENEAPTTQENTAAGATAEEKESPESAEKTSWELENEQREARRAEKNVVKAQDDAREAEEELSRLQGMVSTQASPAEQVAIPNYPSKGDIQRTMDSLMPRIKKCRGNESGKLVVKLIISGATGKVVSSRTVDELFEGTYTGRCAARVVSDASFPVFNKPRLTVKYPYEL